VPCAIVLTKEEKHWKQDGLRKNFFDTPVSKERSAAVRRNFARSTSRTLRWLDLQVCGPVGMQFVS